MHLMSVRRKTTVFGEFGLEGGVLFLRLIEDGFLAGPREKDLADTEDVTLEEK